MGFVEPQEDLSHQGSPGLDLPTFFPSSYFNFHPDTRVLLTGTRSCDHRVQDLEEARGSIYGSEPWPRAEGGGMCWALMARAAAAHRAHAMDSTGGAKVLQWENTVGKDQKKKKQNIKHPLPLYRHTFCNGSQLSCLFRRLNNLIKFQVGSLALDPLIWF